MAQPLAATITYGYTDNTSYDVIPNEGQVVNDLGDSVPSIAYYSSGSPVTYFQKSGILSYVYSTRDTVAQVDTLRRLDISCAGPSANYPDPQASVLRDHFFNFYLPQCGPNGADSVLAYGQVLYQDMFPNIDLLTYSGDNGQKLACVVRPGGDPTDIQLLFQGQDSMVVDSSGNLQVSITGQKLVLPEVQTIQTDSAGTITTLGWTAAYQPNNTTGKVTFSIGTYDHAKPLVFIIGPPPALGGQTYEVDGVCWSTFYGGKSYDYPKDVKADQAGNIYVAGRTESAFQQFPHHNGQFTLAVGKSLATLTKFNPSHVLKWTIYQGGSADVGSKTSAGALAIKEDPTRIYIVGTTDADDFLTQGSPGAYNQLNNNNNNNKGFVCRYKGSNGFLQWSTYIGYSNVSVQGIDVVPYTGQIAISGTTKGSLPLGNYLPSSGGYQFDTYHGNQDAFLALFDASDGVVWSAFYGGSHIESSAIVRWTGKSLVLAGDTKSQDLPMIGASPNFQQGYAGSTDIFIAQISLTGNLEWATYFGGPGDDLLAPQGMTAPRDLFITGTCRLLPTLVNGPGWYANVPSVPGNGFIARFQVDNHQPKWITYLGHGAVSDHSPYCITADPNYYTGVTIGGYTGDAGFPIHFLNGLYNQSTIVADENGTKDGFLIRFDDGQNLEWGTYFGGEGNVAYQPENVTSVLDLGTSTYAVGYTSMTNGNANNNNVITIPLVGNPNSLMFFNPLYNYDGLTGNYTDGFVTQFCNDIQTLKRSPAWPDEAPTGDHLKLTWASSSDLVLLDLTDGQHQVRVYDAQGRLVLDQQVSSAAGRSEGVRIGDENSAVYLVVVDNTQTGRVVPIR